MAVRARIQAASVLGLAGLVLLSAGAHAGADTGDAGLQSIVDVSAYPAPLPVGCPEGAAALVSITFSNGFDPPQTDLSEVSLGAGDTVTMRWDRFAPGCLDSEGNPTIAVSLAPRSAHGGVSA